MYCNFVLSYISSNTNYCVFAISIKKKYFSHKFLKFTVKIIEQFLIIVDFLLAVTNQRNLKLKYQHRDGDRFSIFPFYMFLSHLLENKLVLFRKTVFLCYMHYEGHLDTQKYVSNYLL